MNHPHSIDRHEVLGILGRGGMGWVYRVKEPDSSEEVALKLLHNPDGLSRLDRLRFEREYKLAASFHHPCLVPVYHYGVDGENPYYTMEHVVGQNLRDCFGDVRSPGGLEQIGLVAGRLLHGLEYIHAQGIVHRDLKPENVLVDAGNIPRLLDFGIARHGMERPVDGELKERLTEPGTVLGTVHYMAPEQVTGAELDHRSDQYSLGVILYEILAGKLPFDGPDAVAVLGQILHTEAEPLPEELPPPLRKLVERLLRKEPSDRYLTTGQVLEEWLKLFAPGDKQWQTSATALRSPVPTAPEELYPPRFVGREQEFKAIVALLRDVHEGAAHFILVEGTSGVGKSRLVSECVGQMRSLDLPVVTGEAIEAESLPYGLWVEVIRWAAADGLPRRLTPFREVLSMLAPSLGKEEDPPPDWRDPLRKYHLFEGMLRLLRHVCRGGAVLLLEDLQWADPASLEFLHYLARTFVPGDEEDKPPQVALMASFREEELGRLPLLESTLASLERASIGRRIKLDPLSQEETGELVGSMLGCGRLEEGLLERMFEETEGNPLFVEEILKTFLSEGRLRLDDGEWNLDTTSSRRLPTGGSRLPKQVRAAVKRRLEGLAGEALQVMRTAAALGYHFSFEVLARVVELPELELLELLLGLVQRRILAENPRTGDFRFYNHPIVEVILEAVPLEERRKLHSGIARALEEMYPQEKIVMELARHHQLAGDPAAAAVHLVRAAEASAQAFGYQRAVELYKMAARFPEVERVLPTAKLQERLADVSFCAGLTESALEKYTWLTERCDQPLEKARLLRKLGECWERLGDLSLAYRCLIQALECLDYRPMSRSLLAKLTITWRVLAFSIPALARPYRRDPTRARELHRTCHRLARVMFLSRPTDWLLDSLDLALTQQMLARVLEEKEASAQAELFLGYMFLRAPGWLNSMALNHLHGAATLASDLPDTPFKGAIIRDAGYLLFLAGCPELGRDCCGYAVDLTEELGDIQALPQNHTQLNAIYCHLGQLDKAAYHALRACSVAESTGSRSDSALARAALTRSLAMQGRLDEAATNLDLAREYSARVRAPYVEMLVDHAECWLEFMSGHYSRVAELAAQGDRSCRAIRSLPFYRLEFQLAELWALLETGEHKQVGERLPRLASQLERYRALRLSCRRLEGRLLLEGDHREEGLALLERCVREAARAELPLEGARAHELLALHQDTPSSRRKHTWEARALYQRAGAHRLSLRLTQDE